MIMLQRISRAPTLHVCPKTHTHSVGDLLRDDMDFSLAMLVSYLGGVKEALCHIKIIILSIILKENLLHTISTSHTHTQA